MINIIYTFLGRVVDYIVDLPNYFVSNQLLHGRFKTLEDSRSCYLHEYKDYTSKNNLKFTSKGFEDYCQYMDDVYNHNLQYSNMVWFQFYCEYKKYISNSNLNFSKENFENHCRVVLDAIKYGLPSTTGTLRDYFEYKMYTDNYNLHFFFKDFKNYREYKKYCREENLDLADEKRFEDYCEYKDYCSEENLDFTKKGFKDYIELNTAFIEEKDESPSNEEVGADNVFLRELEEERLENKKYDFFSKKEKPYHLMICQSDSPPDFLGEEIEQQPNSLERAGDSTDPYYVDLV